jgi:predicted tellurium resistance membrane protein TerC
MSSAGDRQYRALRPDRKHHQRLRHVPRRRPSGILFRAPDNTGRDAMAELLTFSSLAALATLAALEIVLGIDNVVFLAILSGRLPEEQRQPARLIGLSLAAIGRIALLFAITWVITLDEKELFALGGHAFTVKDLILAAGGLFLLAKATWEIHHSIEAGPDHHDAAPAGPAKNAAGFGMTLVQIFALDMVFSIDSVLTAVGMVKPDDFDARWVPLAIMITAIVVAIAIMLVFAGALSRFIEKHPTMKMLALSFLLLIGLVLVAEGLGQHIPRGYIYFSMGFSLFVELLNLRFTAKKKRKLAASCSASIFVSAVPVAAPAR